MGHWVASIAGSMLTFCGTAPVSVLALMGSDAAILIPHKIDFQIKNATRERESSISDDERGSSARRH